jgi:tetratricopeptide (TPR) repeat protein
VRDAGSLVCAAVALLLVVSLHPGGYGRRKIPGYHLPAFLLLVSEVTMRSLGEVIHRSPRSWLALGVLLFAAFAVAAAPLCPPLWVVRPSFAAELPPTVERAVFQEDWPTVLRLLDSAGDRPPSGMQRLIKGHACLATNRANESLCLFAGVSRPDLARWCTLTRYWAFAHRDHAIAHYLYGDALARRGEWRAAIQAYDAGLKRRPAHPLLLNARGVVYAKQAEFDRAVLDLSLAARATPALGDAAASLGATYLAKGSGAQGAFDAFSRALEVDPESALARISRACAACALGRLNTAEGDLVAARKAPPCVLSALRGCISGLLASLSDAERQDFARLTSAQLGASATAAFDKLKADPWSSSTRNRFFDTMARLRQTDQPLFNTKMSEFVPQIKGDHGLKAAFASALATQMERNRPGGLIDKALGALSGIGLSLPLPKGGKVTFDAGGLSGSLRQSRDQKFQAFQDMNQIAGGLGSRHLGGVDLGVRNAHVDGGGWRYVPSFGLCYPLRRAAGP